MFGSSHQITVKPVRGGRKYVAECSCGRRSWETVSSTRAHQLGAEHQASAQKKGK